MIRTQVCWDATVRLVFGAVIIAVGQVAAQALLDVTLIGWALALAVVVPAMLLGVFMMVKGLWLVVEEAAREAVQGRPRSDILTDE